MHICICVYIYIYMYVKYIIYICVCVCILSPSSDAPLKHCTRSRRSVGQGAWKPGFIFSLHGTPSSHGASDQQESSRKPKGLYGIPS